VVAPVLRVRESRIAPIEYPRDVEPLGPGGHGSSRIIGSVRTTNTEKNRVRLVELRTGRLELYQPGRGRVGAPERGDPGPLRLPCTTRYQRATEKLSHRRRRFLAQGTPTPKHFAVRLPKDTARGIRSNSYLVVLLHRTLRGKRAGLELRMC